VLLAGLSTGHKIGLLVVGAVFIAFALTSALVIPRRRPEYPGKNGLSVFIIVSLALFLAMLTAVVVFGVESEAKGAEAGGASEAHAPSVILLVTETEFAIKLPSTAQPRPPGNYTFRVMNAGKIQHDFVVQGPGVANAKTPLISPHRSATLKVALEKGTYTVYCSVPGHRAAGMVARLTIT
jgi:uncharacterized cupredoxin-like copper-binding protein